MPTTLRRGFTLLALAAVLMTPAAALTAAHAQSPVHAAASAPTGRGQVGHDGADTSWGDEYHPPHH